MIKERIYKAISYSAALEKIKNKDHELYLSKYFDPCETSYGAISEDEAVKVLSTLDLEPGNIFEKTEIEYPNQLDLGYLYVEKSQDGSVQFRVLEDYDIYSTELTNDQVKELVSFLQKSA